VSEIIVDLRSLQFVEGNRAFNAPLPRAAGLGHWVYSSNSFPGSARPFARQTKWCAWQKRICLQSEIGNLRPCRSSISGVAVCEITAMSLARSLEPFSSICSPLDRED